MTIRSLFRIKTTGWDEEQIYWMDHLSEFSSLDLERLELLVSDSVDQQFIFNSVEQIKQGYQFSYYKPGVTDNSAHSLRELLLTDSSLAKNILGVYSGLGSQQREIKVNPLIQTLVKLDKPDLHSFLSIPLGTHITQNTKVTFYDLDESSDDELSVLSQKNSWALSLKEMKAIQNHFAQKPMQQLRVLAGLKIEPSDVEVEMIAQTWSEHCKHKIFAARIEYREEGKTETIYSLFKSYIKNPTYQLNKPWAVSVFDDNAGVVRFRDDLDLCIKVETHNSPSALDPYGGALTGILGVNRDILGTGLGAKPVANTNVFCVGLPDEKDVPLALKHPKEILEGIHRGIQDGGNKSGIPTVNGAIYFDSSYRGKPLVYCGSVGVSSPTLLGTDALTKAQRVGDHIIMVGGAVGMDGIHGATASSLVMDKETTTGMVQIGDPFTQKKMTDFILKAREKGLYNSITDNGAGGLSSSVGEMAQLTGGAILELSEVPLKYSGLSPWQILVSESQERMTLSVPSEHLEELMALAEIYDVNCTRVGIFTDSGFFHCKYQGETVAMVDMNFLHHGCPQLELKAHWPSPQRASQNVETTLDHREISLRLLSHPTIASKEKWVRQYDHEVQGASVVKPFEGLNNTAPNDAAVMWYGAYGVEGFDGFSVASGLCPHFSLYDTHLMAKMAVDEAVRNLLCHGVDLSKVALVDNFCWPDPTPSSQNPDAEFKMAQLVRACKGLQEMVECYEMPLVSGKDSMKNDYQGEDQKISVLPTLLVTALGYVKDVRKVIRSYAEKDHYLYRVGVKNYDQYFGHFLSTLLCANNSDRFNWKEVRSLYSLISLSQEKGLIRSMHDVSEGGFMPALFETLKLHQLGIHFEINPSFNENAYLYSELPGHFIVSVEKRKQSQFEASLPSIYWECLGITQESGEISFGKTTLKMTELDRAWRSL